MKVAFFLVSIVCDFHSSRLQQSCQKGFGKLNSHKNDVGGETEIMAQQEPDAKVCFGLSFCCYLDE